MLDGWHLAPLDSNGFELSFDHVRTFYLNVFVRILLNKRAEAKKMPKPEETGDYWPRTNNEISMTTPYIAERF